MVPRSLGLYFFGFQVGDFKLSAEPFRLNQVGHGTKAHGFATLEDIQSSVNGDFPPGIGLDTAGMQRVGRYKLVGEPKF